MGDAPVEVGTPVRAVIQGQSPSPSFSALATLKSSSSPHPSPRPHVQGAAKQPLDSAGIGRWRCAALDKFLAALEAGAEEWAGHSGSQGVEVCTIHQAKGLEWEHVVVARVNESTLPLPFFPPSHMQDGCHAQDANQLAEEHEEEERRLLYVAMTRAKSSLTLTHILFDDHGELCHPSRFLQEIRGNETALVDAFQGTTFDPAPTKTAVPNTAEKTPARTDMPRLPPFDNDPAVHIDAAPTNRELQIETRPPLLLGAEGHAPGPFSREAKRRRREETRANAGASS
eukprot:CAMPEP_0175912242 /NCGR_PEP_ID=MMETSP0108-20121206/8619_1 /TAXON_ID=195067 ORGANISM="Goniomonas pacifica, Strain CCMP1869" /NCGR_SAMPLE_ID=MMETSP0108 /ASSEMBLY_ACC=CAM_ASM_000204 /LENGTH=284 /DNA_ID=CAMNT_0017234535 /DNA_START=83 /DNA_END=937 /DNA_ORIENTATION=+